MLKKIIVCLLLSSCILSVFCFADESTTEIDIASVIESFAEDETIEKITIIESEIKTELKTDVNTEPQTTVSSVGECQNQINTHGMTTFVCNETIGFITLTVQHESKQYVFTFSPKNNWTFQEDLPSGEYSIISCTTNAANYKKQVSVSIDGDKQKTINLNGSNYQTVTFHFAEKKMPYIIGFLKREWYLLIILIVSYVVYRKRVKDRVLPSQEH